MEDSFQADVDRARAMRAEQDGGSRGHIPQSAWSSIARGKTVGKSGIIQFFSPVRPGPLNQARLIQNVTVNLLSLDGQAENAQQVCLTLAPPEFLSQTGVSAPGGNIQALNGLVDSITQVNAGNGAAAGGGCFGGAVQASTIAAAINDAGKAIIPANPCIEVLWGIGGVSYRVEADYVNGLCLNLECSSLRVNAYVEGLTTYRTSDAFYRLGAFVGPGNAKPNNAQKTVQMGNINITAESGMMTVPRFAKSVSLVGANRDHDVYTGTVRFYRDPNLANNFVIAEYFFSGNTANQLSAPVPNGALYFTVMSGINGSGDAPTNPLNDHNAVFQLAV